MGLHFHSVCSASATLNSARLEPPRPLPLAPRCTEKASSTRGGGRGLCLVFSSCRYGSSIYGSGSPAVPPPHTHPANIYWMNASGVSPPPSPQPLPQGFLPSHLITPKPRERALARNIKEKKPKQANRICLHPTSHGSYISLSLETFPASERVGLRSV